MSVTLNEEKCLVCHKYISTQTAAMLKGLCHDCFLKGSLALANGHVEIQSA
jgi:hypothetical protein